jgi:transcriptional regulator with XRE-family HTH domain
MKNNNLKKWREREGLSVDEVARGLNLSPSYYYNLENNTKRLNEDILNLLWEKFGVTANTILGHEFNTDEMAEYNIVFNTAKNSNLKPDQLDKLIKHYLALLKEGFL